MSAFEQTTPHWRRSSHSDHHGGECVEVGDALWRKSSHSGHQGGECVEIAELAAVVAVRDSKDPEGPKLLLSPLAWRSLALAVKQAEHDLA
ncbi:DUF397 domain-containing protein [Spirillospora sp. CA-294931]|uniref:DUF397 domain-containing protein n=1 Tax=Spirillospora sp. CA-294931 TaxID=3240042 RepID=UPI003D8D247A